MNLLGTIKELHNLGITNLEIRLIIVFSIISTLLIGLTPFFIYVIKHKKYSKKIKSSDLLNHYFFQLAEYTSNVRVDQFDFKCNFKNTIFKKLLKSKYTLLAKNLRQAISISYDNTCDLQQSLFGVLELTRTQMIISFHEILKEYTDQTVSINDSSIPVSDYVYQKFIKEWDYPNYEAIRLNFEKIVNAGIYENSVQRLDAALNICTSEIELLNLTVEKGLREINGLFKHIKI